MDSPIVTSLDIDEQQLRSRVQAERLQQFMSLERLTAASGALPSGYAGWIMWGSVDPVAIVVWWLMLLATDLSTVVHTSLYLRRPQTSGADAGWLRRQLLLQSLAGVVWGCAVPLAGHSGIVRVEADVGLVLITVNSIAVIGLLAYRGAVLGWTLGVWSAPALYFLLNPTPRNLQMCLGIAVLVVSLNFYLWRASGQLVQGLERRFRADALAQALQGAVQRIQELATRDDLTGVFNRGYGMDALLQACGSATGRRTGDQRRDMALLVIDIDWFKRVNDEHGHPAGDAVLREVSQRLLSQLRRADVLARIGGEEFIVVAPETGAEGAVELAERLRAAVGREPVLTGEARLAVTVSVGVATLLPGEAVQALLGRADAALYQAKRDGRDRVKLADPAAPEPAPSEALVSA